MSQSRWCLASWLFAAVAPAWVGATDLTIYDDALQNSFQDYSYGLGSNFAATAYTYAGSSDSIAFTGNNYNAISFYHATAFTTAQYPILHFYVNGGAGSGQKLRMDIQNAGALVANVAIDAYIQGGSIAAGTWREVSIDLTAPPLSYVGSYDRVDLQSDMAPPQTMLYVDSVSLRAAALANDPVFANGFENTTLPPASNGLVEDHDVTVASMLSDRFTWHDSANHPRVAVLAHNDGPAGPDAGVYANHGGAMREFRYQMPDTSTRIANVTTYGNGGYGGFGYVVSHSADQYCSGDDSPLGYSFPGSFVRVFEGRHHAIFRFTQNYQRHCGPTSPPPTTLIPVTIDWVFSTGHDNPLWAIAFNLQPAGADFLFDDSRAPYGELNIDGDGSTDIDGTAWGDKFKFTSTSAPVTLSSSWTWNLSNTVPYVKEWIVSTDATMGLVQTQTIDQQDAGGGRNPNYQDLTPYWGKTSANGNAGGAYSMPYQDGWPYQANNDSIGVGVSNNNARLTWGTQYGFLGQTLYASNTNTAPGDNGPNLPGYPRKSYSVYVVMGPHSAAPVETQVTQVETVQSLTLTASTGSVATTGPAGIDFRQSDIVSYAPAGYNHVYGALAFNASASRQLDANIAVGSGTLKKPMLILGSYTGGYPSSVKLNGTTLVVDVDYFPSLRAAASELWLTFNGNFSGSTNHIQISP